MFGQYGENLLTLPKSDLLGIINSIYVNKCNMGKVVLFLVLF